MYNIIRSLIPQISRSRSNHRLVDPESGGRSTSIIWLLHRLAPTVHQHFAFHDELRWANNYGLLESVRKRKVGSEPVTTASEGAKPRIMASPETIDR